MKKRLPLLLFLVAAALLCIGLPRLLMPPRTDYGATWSAFLKEPADSADVLFFGSSIVYCDVVPAVLWEETGLSSYVMAGPEQILPQTYYYLRECLKTQSPKVVCIELMGMFFPEYTDFTKVNIGYMPDSLNRLGATLFAAEPAERAGLLFPLYNYHDRWNDPALTLPPPAAADPLAGYTFLGEANAATAPVEYPAAQDEAVYQRNLKYLQKCLDLCEAEGITPVLYLGAGYSRLPAAAVEKLQGDLPGLLFWDMNEDFDALGIDPAADFYDYLHFNCRGAEKFTRAFGRRLQETLGLSGSADAEVWESRLAHFRVLAAQT